MTSLEFDKVCDGLARTKKVWVEHESKVCEVVRIYEEGYGVVSLEVRVERTQMRRRVRPVDCQPYMIL